MGRKASYSLNQLGLREWPFNPSETRPRVTVRKSDATLGSPLRFNRELT